jgi:hypothetical protein
VEKFQRAGGRVIAADHAEWLKKVQQAIGHPAVLLHGPPTVRAIVRDQPRRTLVHLLNLNLERLSSFDDRVRPATDIQLTVRVPFARVRSVRALTADSDGTSGPLPFSARSDDRGAIVELTVPHLEIALLLVIE